ncbi:class I SAM-dependent methyltransferase [Kutzneria albida]|uniref:Methyltransferase type 11 domain-containing protein n=1 Tax=Kutzneria albida DSM 43870 TaxID=1449976 RepID=W5W5I7_9PSEU|nr:class I SAM-dependent methyltransferase [Kutzneria albida]AHH96132.1 hypothetical protein KALB_2764 [Kutzneria albida DSM 43870]
MPVQVADQLYGRLRAELGPGPVLDVGIGTGAVSAELVARGVPVLLLDVVDMRGPHAPAAPFVLGSACELPIGAESVTGVHLARVLHHVPDWRLALAEALRVLVPGGALCLTLGGRLYANQLASLRDQVFDAGERLGLRGAHHVHEPRGVEAVDAELGIEPEVVEYRFDVTGTPRQAVTDAANHTYAWQPGQDLTVLRPVADQVLTESGLDPDAPITHERVVSYRIYRKPGESRPQ